MMTRKTSLWDKIKDIFVDDEDEEPIQPETYPQQAAESQAAVAPKKAASPKKKPAASNNYIENKSDALQLITTCLSKYSYSKDKNLGLLELWVIRDENSDIVNWADEEFLDELRAALHQQCIDAVKRIRVYSPTYQEFIDIKKARPNIIPIERTRIYYHTSAIGAAPIEQVMGKAAWLVCVKGEDAVQQQIVPLDPSNKRQWNIGRGLNDTSLAAPNDIIINSDCRDVSRNQAAILNDSGHYYLACHKGGCRALGGTVTKIIRANGAEQELRSLSPKILSPLSEGDIIMLAHTVYYRFTYQKPD
ncbi:MAG: hypothetical protein NC217_06175 [Muribaculaceae bacterium]|nr:hypothetical protein [Muribaculaceae bacterium]